MKGKGLDHESETEVKVTIRVTETEKKLLDGLAGRFPTKRGPKGPSMGQAVVHLVRVALQCLAYHVSADQQEPRKVGRRTLERLLERHSASVVTKRTLQKPRIYTERPDGSKAWDEYED